MKTESWTASVHLHRAGLGDMPVGQTLVEQIGWDVEYGGADYKFRYGFSGDIGSVPCIVTRNSSTTWTITAQQPQQDIAALWTGTGTGDPTVVTSLGTYYAYFNLVITLK